MRNSERLRALKAWAYKTLCQGREMKAPGEDMDITQIVRQEPQVYLSWWPTRPDSTGLLAQDPQSVAPGIVIAPSAAYSKYVEERRFDRYNNIHRLQEMGQWLNVSILFSVYEPGVRLPGFVQSADDPEGLDMSKLKEGTEEGLMTLMNWMDDCTSALLADRFIPHSDLILDEMNLTYSPFMDQNYVVDKRPLYYGFVNAKFMCYADDRNNSAINDYLK